MAAGDHFKEFFGHTYNTTIDSIGAIKFAVSYHLSEREKLLKDFLQWFLDNESEYDYVTIDEYVKAYLKLKDNDQG